MNNSLANSTFEQITDSKYKSMSIEDLYKYLKGKKLFLNNYPKIENLIDYDDIKGIYERAIESVDAQTLDTFKAEVVSELQDEK